MLLGWDTRPTAGPPRWVPGRQDDVGLDFCSGSSSVAAAISAVRPLATP